jgi:hypothetical protein
MPDFCAIQSFLIVFSNTHGSSMNYSKFLRKLIWIAQIIVAALFLGVMIRAVSLLYLFLGQEFPL